MIAGGLPEAVKKTGEIAEFTRAVLRSLRPVVVGLVVVAQMLACVAHGIGQRVEALTGDGDRVGVLVTGLPHPLTTMATHRLELDLHAPGTCKTLHRPSPFLLAAASRPPARTGRGCKVSATHA